MSQRELDQDQGQEETASAVSRRGFLKGMGGGLLGTATVGTGLLGEEVGAAVSGPPTLSGPQRITLSINGKRTQVEVEPRTTLLEALRDRLNLTGSKEVCDRGQCGACTVLLDDKAILGCMMLAVNVGEREVTTVEGLAEEGEMSELQAAFVQQDALMCGFCTPGFVVSAEALLRSNPNPTAEQIRQGVSGNLCRCGTYPKVFEAIEVAAKNRRGR
jgi:aerobic-type carbon monoxide dehydrogenase small subunit (CoxS/CutS family)